MVGQMDRQLYRQIVIRQTNKWMDRQMVGKTDIWMDRWTYEWADKQIGK